MKTVSLGAKLMLALTSLLVTLAAIEIGARIWLWHIADDDAFNTYASINQLRDRYGADFLSSSAAVEAPHRYLGYYPSPNYHRGPNRHNALGYRGEEIAVPKPEGVFRIVCLGGSTTYSVYLDDYRFAYPFMLQHNLREAGYTQIEVVNAGASAYTSWESLVNFQFRVLDLEPDMIIVYHGINDVHPRLVWPPDVYRGDNSGAMEPNIQEIQMPPFWEYSTALRTIMIQLGEIESHSSFNRTVRSRPETYYADLFRTQYENGTYPDGIFRDVSAQAMLETNPPVYFERNIQNMVAAADAHGVTVVLLTFAWSPLFTNEARVASPEYQFAFRQTNAILREIAASTRAYVFDLAAEMPTDTKYFSDGRHFTFEGNARRARLIADYLLANDLLAQGDDE